MPEASKRVEIKIIYKKEKMKEINAINISKSNQLIKGEQIMPKPKNQKSLRKMQKMNVSFPRHLKSTKDVGGLG